MRNVTRIFLYAVASAALAATCSAQAKPTRPAKREKQPQRVTRMVVIAPAGPAGTPPTESNSVGQAKVIYLPGQDHTSVVVTLPKVYRRGEVSADLEFNVGFKGRQVVKPDGLRWVFASDWDIFASAAPLNVTADGEQYSFKVQREYSLPGQHVGGIDLATFERIANSKSARLSVGRVSFDLTEAQRAALRDMLKVFETPAKP